MGNLFIKHQFCKKIVRFAFFSALAIISFTARDSFSSEPVSNQCPSFSSNYEQIRKASRALKCAKDLKINKQLTCLPDGLIHSSSLLTESGKMGLIASDNQGKNNYYIFNGSKLFTGPSLLDVMSGQIFKTAELEKASRLMFKDLENNKDIFVYGHSQGAMSAQIASYFALKRYFLKYGHLPTAKIQIISFGSPGNWGLMTMADPNFDIDLFRQMELIQIISNRDPAPPHDTFIDPPYLITETSKIIKGKVINTENIYDHLIRSYAKKVENKSVCFAQKTYPQKYNNYFEGESRLFKFVKSIKNKPATVQEIMERYDSEKEYCMKLPAESLKTACLDNLNKYNNEIEARLKSLPANEPFSFNPLVPASK